MATVFLNGRYCTPDEARVSAFDAGFQHAVGLFETMAATLVEGEAVVRGLEAHLERLRASAGALGLSDSLRVGALAEAVCQTVERAGYPRARVRLTVTGGDLNLLPTRKAEGRAPRASHDPTVMIVAQAATEHPAEMFEQGVPVVIADAKANPLNPTEGHKTLNYWWRLRELQVAATKRAGEAIVLQITNHLCGGCVSNIFLAKEGELRTPIARGEEDTVGGAAPGASLPSPVLPGTTRGEIIAWAAGAGLRVERRMLSVGDLLDADEVFLTNCGWGVLPVVAVEASTIGDGRVGPLTRRAREAWLAASR